MYKVIIVTGASSGLGAEFARQLVVRDADEIWLVARRADRLASLATAIGPTARVIAADISGRAGGTVIATALSETALSHADLTVDTLVNCAGFGTYGPFAETSLYWQLDEVDLNVTSLTAICGVTLPYLSPGSRIINTASLAAFAPMGNFAVYAATKAYVLNFTLGLAAELKGRDVSVIALCPGPVDTEFSNVASKGVREKVTHGKSPRSVTAHCLRRLDAGGAIAMMAPVWKIKAFFSRVLPLPFLAKLTMVFEKRPAARKDPPAEKRPGGT